MAGPLTIQRFPTALLDLLGMKAGGVTPVELGAQLVSTVDTWALYSLDRLVLKTGTSSALGAAGSIFPSAGTPTTVPAGELWDVWSVVLEVTGGAALAAGTTYRVAPVNARFGLTAAAELLAPYQSFTVGEKPIVGAVFRPGTYLARPTDAILGWAAGVTVGTAVTWDISVLCVPYRV